jgi:ABC-type glycerol-3-phosphate transport system substrate-binding protein
VRKNFIKGLALGMAVCMGVVGCGSNSTSSNTGNETQGSKEETTVGKEDETTTEAVAEKYPAYDFGGQTFTLLNQNDLGGKNPAGTDDEFQKEERQAKIDYIQEKYNCVLEFVDAPSTNWDEIPQELVNAYTAGQPIADIMDVYYNYLAPLVINGLLYDMTAEFADDTTYNKANTLTFLGKTYGICSAIAGEGLYYNKDMIADAGMEYTPAEMFAMGQWDYESCYQYLTELKSKMGEDEYPLFIYPYYWALFASTANGVKLLGDDGNLCYVNDNFIETIEFAYRCISEGLSPIPLTDTGSYNNWGYCGTTFDQGHTVAIGHRAAWQAAGLVSVFDVGFVPYPWGKGVSIDEDKIGDMDAYLTLSDDYMQTYYDGQVMSFICNITEKADPMELTSMMCELMGWDFMLASEAEETNLYAGWLEDGTIDDELYAWTRTREVWQYYNSIAGDLWESNLSWNKMLYENAGIRSTLQSAYTAEMAGVIEAGLATEDVLTDVE